MRILIVDDHTRARRFIREMIAPLAFEVFEASDGLESVEICSRLKPDYVTMDLFMDGIDGLEATRRIRANRPGTKIIVVSANGDPELKESAERAGACLFVAKSDLTELLRYLEAAACLRSKGAGRDTEPGNSSRYFHV